VHKAILARLQKRRVLEDFRDFLNPLKLPTKLTLRLSGCAGTINAWYSAQKVTVCYEYIDWVRQLAPTATTEEGITPEDAVVGPFVDVMLHEISHAVIDILKVPVLGREEDAADSLAAFILLQFGKEVARRVPISSTKGSTGHCLGAAGALEAIFCTLALKEGVLPPTINYESEDEDCDLDYIANEAREADARIAVSNSFGFGGHNATIVLARCDE